MRDGDATAGTSAQAFIARLAERGIEYVFANAGTDFAPIVEALSHSEGRKYPRFVVVPHENVAISMAQGYYRVAGKPAAVMVHVTVGTANALCGLMNAAKDNIPVLLAAGRTPLTETGSAASRNRSIHWGQEMFDQASVVREFVKWDYELRLGQSVAPLVDRALDIAMTEPRGPVYMTLPREVLAAPAVSSDLRSHALGASAPVPSIAAIEAAAHILAKAEFPLIVTSSSGRSAAGFAALTALAEDFAIPVVQSEARDINISTAHPMHLGFMPDPLVKEADVILLIDTVVPWMPRIVAPKRDAKIIHMSIDPLAAGYPYSEFEADLLIAGESAAAMTMLREVLGVAMKGKEAGIAARRKRVAASREEMETRRRRAVEAASTQTPISVAWLTSCLNAVKSENAFIVNELGLAVGQLDLTRPGTYMGNNPAGGLGMGMGAALGAKLAAPERDVIVAVGDGSYMFGNPVPYHYVQQAENLATLTIIANNSSWHAVRAATLDVYPDGHASKANSMPLTELKPSPAYEKTIETCGGYGERVDNPAALPDALRRGMDMVRKGTPVLLNVITRGR